MRAYIGIKYHADNSNRPRIELISNALAACRYSTVCVIRDVEEWGAQQFDPETLMQRTFLEIETCDVVIVDLTEKGVGVGIEAGYAHARGIPVVVIAEEGADVSTTLQGIAAIVYHYQELSDLKAFFADF
ncbi:MAG: hypothetical protein KC413_17465 [Anaerolineales bacterium]|nr:hypothetical protein [Anaerolineales bacterium]